MAVEVTADLTASVVRIVTEVGVSVARGDVLLLVESMKMEIPVTAPQAGRVRAVQVEAGDVITEGDVLVILDDVDLVL